MTRVDWFSIPRLRISLRTLMLGVLAAGAWLSWMVIYSMAPRIRGPVAAPMFVVMVTLALILPTLWMAAWRRQSFDRLLIHVAIVCAVIGISLSATRKPGTNPFLLPLALLGLSSTVPSVAWYVSTRLKPGSACNQARRFVVGSALEIGQVAVGVSAIFLAFILHVMAFG